MRAYNIGVDEAGRGPVIGPLVVCALAIPEGDYSILEKMGVKDSKSLSKAKRGVISRSIREKCMTRGWKLGISICEPVKIDLNSIKSNLNTLEVELFSESIKKTVPSRTGGSIYVDACDTDQDRFGNNVKFSLGNEWSKWDIISKHRLDQSNLLVGASSIIAKDVRDSAISDLSEKLGMDIGSGYPSDPKTKIAVVELISRGTPHDCLRWSWSTVKNAWLSLHNSPVPTRSDGGGKYSQTDLRGLSDSNHK